MFTAFLSLFKGFRPPPFLYVLAAVAIVGGIMFAQWRASLDAAATIAQLTNDLRTARGTIGDLTLSNVRLVEINATTARSAEKFGRRSATLDAAARHALERIGNAPRTNTCLGVPVIRDALASVRAQRAAIDGGPTPARDDPGSDARANAGAGPNGE